MIPAPEPNPIPETPPAQSSSQPRSQPSLPYRLVAALIHAHARFTDTPGSGASPTAPGSGGHPKRPEPNHPPAANRVRSEIKFPR